MALKKYRRQVIRVRDANDELPEVILSTGDEAGRIIQLQITNGENYGTQCRFWLQKEEGTNVYQDMEQVTASYPTWEAAINTGGLEPGLYPCMFRIGDNDGSVTETFKTVARVLQGMLIDAEESEEMQSQLSEFEQRTEDAIDANETATAAATEAAEAATTATEAIEHALDEVDVRVLTTGVLSVTNVDGVPTSYDVKQQVSDAINPKIEDADAATQAANDAATAANSAATSATDAAAAATSATSAATQAATAANSAASSATSAASDARAAATSANSAAASATSAAAAANTAAESITVFTSKGVNLFDKNNVSSIKGFINTGTNILVSNNNARSIYIPCNPNSVYTVSSIGNKLIVAYSDTIPQTGMTVHGTISKGVNDHVTIITDDNTNYLIAYVFISTTDTYTFAEICDALQIETGDTATSYAGTVTAKDDIARKNVNVISEVLTSDNVLDPYVINKHRGKYCNISGTIGSDSKYSYSNMIPVDEGDVVYLVINSVFFEGRSVSQRDALKTFRFVTAYNAANEVLPSAGSDGGYASYTVPSGVAYIICTIYLEGYDTGGYAININHVYPYDDFYYKKVFPAGVKENELNIRLCNKDILSNATSISKIKNTPISELPDYIANVLNYKPLPSLDKGYICLVSDDGREGLATYTIPMVINKGIPCTFAVMSSSEVFQNSTYQEMVLDAVNNHSCAISQHGGENWTTFSEERLIEFFDDEQEFFDSLELPVKSATIPSHYTSPLIQIVAGGRFGVVRSGYSGHDAQGNPGTIHNYYNYCTSGEGSNLYGLSSYNFAVGSVQINKNAIDYAKANNKILIAYWHENSLTETSKAIIEDSIDYALSQGLEFITLDQIQFLHDWHGSFI